MLYIKNKGEIDIIAASKNASFQPNCTATEIRERIKIDWPSIPPASWKPKASDCFFRFLLIKDKEIGWYIPVPSPSKDKPMPKIILSGERKTIKQPKDVSIGNNIKIYLLFILSERIPHKKPDIALVIIVIVIKKLKNI